MRREALHPETGERPVIAAHRQKPIRPPILQSPLPSLLQTELKEEQWAELPVRERMGNQSSSVMLPKDWTASSDSS